MLDIVVVGTLNLIFMMMKKSFRLLVLIIIGFSSHLKVSGHAGIAVIIQDGCDKYLAIGTWHDDHSEVHGSQHSASGVYIDLNQDSMFTNCCKGAASAEFFSFTDHHFPPAPMLWSAVTSNSSAITDLVDYFNNSAVYNSSNMANRYSAEIVWAPKCVNSLRSWLILKLPNNFNAATDYLCRTSSSSVIETPCTSNNLFTISSTPEVIISGSDEFCQGDSVILVSSAGDDLEWFKDGTKIHGPSSDSILVVSLSGDYTVRRGGVGCISRTSEIHTLSMIAPSVGLGEDKVICKGDSISIDGGEGVAYLWSNGDSSRSIISAGGLHSLTKIDSFGCQSTDEIMVTLLDLPVVNLGEDTTICRSDTLILEVSNIGSNILWSNGTIDSQLKLTSIGDVHRAIDSTSIWVSVQDTAGCYSSDTLKVYNYPLPNAGIKSLVSGQCLNSSVDFSDSSNSTSGSVLSFKWFIDDKLLSDSEDTVGVQFGHEGVFDIKHIVQNDKGCFDSLNQALTIYPTPLAQFSIDDSLECFRDHQIIAVNNSTISQGAIQTIKWSTDGLDYLNIDTLNQVYGSASAYMIQLKVGSDKGCFDSLIKPVTIYPMPVARIAVDTSIKCEHAHLFEFNNSSTVTAGNISHMWYFGDDSLSSMDSPQKSYLKHGVYSVEYVAISDFSCTDTAHLEVEVRPTPEVSFVPSDIALCLKGNDFSFYNTSKIDTGLITQHSWRIDSVEQSTDSSLLNINFNAHGVYTVTLIETSDKNCTDSISQMVTVYPQNNIHMELSDSYQCLRGNDLLIKDSSNIPYTSINRQLVILGDGSEKNMVNNSLTHKYTNVGVYDIKYYTETEFGCKDSMETTFEIKPHPSTDILVVKDSQCFIEHEMQYVGSVNMTIGTVEKIVWNIQDIDTIINETSINKVRYSTPGVKQIELVAISDYGCVDSIIKTARIFPSPSVSISIQSADSCHYTNFFDFEGKHSLSEGYIMSHQWDFEENKKSIVSNPERISYITDTIKTIKYWVVTDNGCSDTARKIIRVHSNPVADFVINKDTQCLNGNEFVFKNNSRIKNGLIDKYYWSLGDGTTSSLSTPPAVSYVDTKSKKIYLVVTSDLGCEDTAITEIYINPSPRAEFTVEPTCLGEVSLFKNKSNVEIGTYTSSWDFGDNTQSNELEPEHVYDRSGSFDIELVVKTDKDCTDSLRIEKAVVVHPKPFVSFGCQKLSSWEEQTEYLFTDSSKEVSEIRWEIDGMTEGYDSDLQFIFHDSGTRRISLIASNEFNCFDTAVKLLSVHPDLVYYKPSGFTPNGDGLNDVFFAAVGLGHVDLYELKIYNRWGELIFVSNEPDYGWNGMYQGKLVQNGAYIYTVSFRHIGTKKRKFENGTVTLLR